MVARTARGRCTADRAVSASAAARRQHARGDWRLRAEAAGPRMARCVDLGQLLALVLQDQQAREVLEADGVVALMRPDQAIERAGHVHTAASELLPEGHCGDPPIDEVTDGLPQGSARWVAAPGTASPRPVAGLSGEMGVPDEVRRGGGRLGLTAAVVRVAGPSAVVLLYLEGVHELAEGHGARGAVHHEQVVQLVSGGDTQHLELCLEPTAGEGPLLPLGVQPPHLVRPPVPRSDACGWRP
mmetsp:Transcript_45271/g.141941  ORF Transcript_45271/g.141941 Transcript_45271/m.141941 type:complete len:242 (-) Transcript_45271:471-1196(-)